jgi:nucleoside-diphosphate-sugar epimerase
MILAGRTAVVTGAAGTVGSVAARRLAREGMDVRALVRRPPAGTFADDLAGLETRVADLSDRAAVQAAVRGADLVVHCAAALSHDAEECRRANIEGTQNLVDAALDAGCERLVHVSTVSVYDARRGLEFTEDSPLWEEPLDWYGYSKAEAERIVRAAGERGLSYVILRPVVIASTHPKSFWGARALDRARSTSEVLFPAVEMPYVHVDNVAEAIVLAAATPAAEGRAYNVVDGIGDTAEYLGRIYGALGRPAPPLPADAPRIRFSGERIRRDLGYAPTERWPEFIAELSRLRL